jgi:hypothetical protein
MITKEKATITAALDVFTTIKSYCDLLQIELRMYTFFNLHNKIIEL